MSDHVETTLPALIFSSTIGGDVDAKARLVIDEDQGADQWWFTWGQETDFEYTHTDSTGSGALLYQAESRTTMGGAAGTAIATASGGTAISQGTLTSTWQAMLSTQASGGGSHLSHVGDFNVFARVQMPTTNTGEVSVAFEWAAGDFRNKTTNTAVAFDANHAREGQWIFQRLGQVSIKKATTGTHRWEGRLIAKSTVAGDDLYVDYLLLVPTSRSGESTAVVSGAVASSFSARDEFDQSSGTLTSKVAPVGGTWAGAGDADDYSVSGAGVVTRTALNDTTNTGRYAISGVSAFATQAVTLDMKWDVAFGTGRASALVARYVDTNNWLQAGVFNNSPPLIVRKRIGGTITNLYTGAFSTATGVFYTARLIVDAAGRWFFWFGRQDSPFLPLIAQGQDSDLATGGTLATGKPGIYDEAGAVNATTRTYDNFAAWVPAMDAAIYSSQSAQVSSESVEREDSSGSFWNRTSNYKGDLLLVPPSGQEGRSIRTVIKACRNDPDTMADTSIDDISAKLNVTQRFLAMPD